MNSNLKDQDSFYLYENENDLEDQLLNSSLIEPEHLPHNSTA